MKKRKFIPRIQRLNKGKPLINPVPDHPWENKVTFNPACVFVSDPKELSGIVERLPFTKSIKATLRLEAGLCFLLYRAQGRPTLNHDYSRSSIGLAILSPTLKLLARHTEPVIQPDKEYDNLGVEDGRITKIGDRYIMVYTAYAFGTPANRIRLALASTKDFVHWKKHGLLKGNFNNIHNKNGMIFEKMMGDHYLMLHRPMEGRNAMSIHWAESHDVFGEWKSRGLLLEPFTHDSFIDTWIGGGAPPLSVSGNRFLILYHIGNRGSNGEKEYFLGFAVADFSSKKIIVKRDEPVLRPETPAETVPAVELGVANVLFPCGAYFFKGDLYMAYGGADSVVLGGKISKGELKKYLAS